MPTHDPLLPIIGGEALGGPGLVVPPGAPALPTVLSATSWLVADLGTGAVLGACGAHEYGAPASLQKLLLAAVVMPKLDARQMVTVTAADMDFEPGSSAVGLVTGGIYSVETLWLGLLLQSGNDAANVLARIGGGSAGVPATLAAMNEYARFLGAYDTHAETSHGLDGPGQATSAYDLALIARACFAREDFARYVATRTTQIPAQPQLHRASFQIQNDNRLLRDYPGALGGKTGFTDIARHTFVGVAERDGRRLIVTLLGAEQRPVRTYRQAEALLDWGFSLPVSASVGRLVAPGEVDKLLASASPAGADAAVIATAVSGVNPRTAQYTVIALIVVGVTAGLVLLLGARRRSASSASIGRSSSEISR
jgi:D-alanyl-D-alanine carboxypeptidase (penicillin-binding protein 5/6)